LYDVLDTFVRAIGCAGLATENIERRIVIGYGRVSDTSKGVVTGKLANNCPLRA
jgi:hypothetical protein